MTMTRVATAASAALLAVATLAQPVPAHAGNGGAALLGFGLGMMAGAAMARPHYGPPSAYYQTAPASVVQPFCRVHNQFGMVIHVEYGRWCGGNTTDVSVYVPPQPTYNAGPRYYTGYGR